LNRRALKSAVSPTDWVFWPAAVALAALLPFIFTDNYFASVAVLFGLYGSISLMWMLVLGTAGIFSLATLAIVGTAAYFVSYFGGATRGGFFATSGWPLWAMLLLGPVVGAATGAIVAAPAVRLRGVYFALLTVGLVQLCQTIVVQYDVLGGGSGTYGAATFVPRTETGTTTARYITYFVAFGLLLACLIVYWLVDKGRLGLLLRTARESEPVAKAMGIDVVRARLGVFLISSTMLGLVGACYVGIYSGVSPEIFSFNTLLLLLAMMIVGGFGSAKGVIIGTALVVFIDQHYAQTGAKRYLALGIIMLVVTLFATDGIVGIPGQIRSWVHARRSLGRSGGLPEPPPTQDLPAADGHPPDEHVATG
jgi:branched-chain amino acid transport system permease protein